MVTAMTPQGTALLSHLQKQHSDQFFDELIPLLDDFTDSTTRNFPLVPFAELILLQTQMCNNRSLSFNRY